MFAPWSYFSDLCLGSSIVDRMSLCKGSATDSAAPTCLRHCGRHGCGCKCFVARQRFQPERWMICWTGAPRWTYSLAIPTGPQLRPIIPTSQPRRARGSALRSVRSNRFSSRQELSVLRGATRLLRHSRRLVVLLQLYGTWDQDQRSPRDSLVQPEHVGRSEVNPLVGCVSEVFVLSSTLFGVLLVTVLQVRNRASSVIPSMMQADP